MEILDHRVVREIDAHHVTSFARSTIQEQAEAHADVRQALFAWFAEAEQANWSSPADIKAAYASASVLANGRVVFNIKGNAYRLVVHVKYQFHAVYVRFFGTHAEYDRIDAETI